MIGAGLSWPVIPLASEIVRIIRQGYPDLPTAPRADVASEYSWYIEQAFKTKEERAEFSLGLIQRKPLSRSNCLLAELLKNRIAGDIVLTTNFDDQVEHALILMGEPVAVVDDLKLASALGVLRESGHGKVRGSMDEISQIDEVVERR